MLLYNTILVTKVHTKKADLATKIKINTCFCGKEIKTYEKKNIRERKYYIFRLCCLEWNERNKCNFSSLVISYGK